MTKSEDSGSPSWGASFFMQTTEDVAKAVAAAAAAATAPRSPRPSVIFSSKDDNGGSQLLKIQRQVASFLKGFSQPPEVKNVTYNPEVLTSLKRQWANFQLQYLDHRSLKEPTRLFESMVVVGLHPNCDIQALERQYVGRKSEGSGKLRSTLSSQNQSRVEPNLEPQVLFVYPPEKQLPLKYKDLLSFCFPGGVEVHAVERTPSMSELNEILLGQSFMSFDPPWSDEVADDSTLYGCCVLVDELVHKPSGLLSIISDKTPSYPSLSRHMLTTRRCYCILSRLPFFELHFAVLNSIFTEERLERLTKGIAGLGFESLEDYSKEENLDENTEETSDSTSRDERAGEDMLNGSVEFSQFKDSEPGTVTDNGSRLEFQMVDKDVDLLKRSINENVVLVEPKTPIVTAKRESGAADGEDCDVYADDIVLNKQAVEKRLPNAVLPLLRYYQYESSESSSSFQGSPCEDRNFRSDIDDTETEEASFSGQDDSSDLIDILEWAKANDHGSLQIICEYYRLHCPARGSMIRFHPLEHLHPLEYHRPNQTVMHIAGSTIDLRSCNSTLEYAEAHNALMVEEEANALSIWAIASLCGSLRLESHFSGINVVCGSTAGETDSGDLFQFGCAGFNAERGFYTEKCRTFISRLRVLIKPFELGYLIGYSIVNYTSDSSLPVAKLANAGKLYSTVVLPNDMLDFLDAPVPYIVGIKKKTNEVSKLSNAILVDANKNQVKSPTIPQLPRQKELLSSLSLYYAKLVGESYLGKKRPMYECTDVQVEAAKGFLSVLRAYLDSLCSNLRTHTITNVQSNDDKVGMRSVSAKGYLNIL
ncbi:hypothetical protein TIFTF001_022155 [Ficus carica]|uniref:cDENN domain-containing protein n=1 Tax=Ficus carica TaxID=3494 RepID=A0AA88ALL8_FICCA|nr:hypothetical protein TIFTF001_022155 [Ficus carica]